MVVSFDTPRDRKTIVRSFVDSNKPGLEIGPSHSPICPKSQGYPVEIVDHTSTEGLRAKYADHGIDLDVIEAVDHVWRGESYAELTGKRNHYGWIVASHMIEHAPDLIAFLQNCEEVLSDDGVLILTVPDKRFCFDHLRRTTSLAAVIDAHEDKRSRHSIGSAVDYYLNVCRLAPNATWAEASNQTLSFIHGMPEVEQSTADLRAGEFVDLHAWCFTPSSFRLILSDLYDLGLTKLREVSFVEMKGVEFFVVLSRSGEGPKTTRLDLAVRAGLEEQIPGPHTA